MGLSVNIPVSNSRLSILSKSSAGVSGFVDFGTYSSPFSSAISLSISSSDHVFEGSEAPCSVFCFDFLTSARISSISLSEFLFIFSFKAFTYLCLAISYIKIPAATDALSELTLPFIGSDTIKSHFSFTRRLIPLPSEPMTRATEPE